HAEDRRHPSCEQIVAGLGRNLELLPRNGRTCSALDLELPRGRSSHGDGQISAGAWWHKRAGGVSSAKVDLHDFGRALPDLVAPFAQRESTIEVHEFGGGELDSKSIHA